MRSVGLQLFASLMYGVIAAVSVPVWAQTIEQPRSVIDDHAAAESDTDLAKQIQNPVGDLISLPLQYNVNFGYGPQGGTQHVLNLQPVIPLYINDDWNV